MRQSIVEAENHLLSSKRISESAFPLILTGALLPDGLPPFQRANPSLTRAISFESFLASSRGTILAMTFSLSVMRIFSPFLPSPRPLCTKKGESRETSIILRCYGFCKLLLCRFLEHLSGIEGPVDRLYRTLGRADAAADTCLLIDDVSLLGFTRCRIHRTDL